MEAPLLTRCFGPPIGFFVFFSLGAAVSQPKKHSLEALSANADSTEGIYVASRTNVVEDSAPKKVDQPAFFRHLDEEPPKAEAFSTANLAEGFITLDPIHTPSDCTWSQWEGWTACSIPCGAGQRQRIRHTDGPHWGGDICSGSNKEFELCNLQGCKVDCSWAHWGPWGPCSKTCGFGLQVRQRGSLPYTGIDGGTTCDDSLKKSSQECNLLDCPAPCTFNPWTLWEGCSKTCGEGGLKRRTRDTKGPYNGGSACIGELFLEEKCNNLMCPVDCAWAAWGGWGVCSRTCGGGIRLRERIYANQVENGGMHCSGSPAELLACNIEDCPIDCKWAAWHDPGPCTKTCGGGVFKRHRAKVTFAHNGGVPCTGPNTEIGPCNVDPCAVDCMYGEWGPWNACSASCAGGFHQSVRSSTDALHGGLDCNEQEKAKEEECNTMNCTASFFEASAWQQAHYHVAVILLVAPARLLMQG